MQICVYFLLLFIFSQFQEENACVPLVLGENDVLAQ